MTPTMLTELVVPLVLALALLTAIKLATRRPASAGRGAVRTPQARSLASGGSTPRASRSAAGQTLRSFAKKGAAVSTISQSTRTPHDVISLALYVEQRKLAGHRAAVRS